MEFRQLRYFVTLANELHFRKAAERLHITQPPLSHSIKLLEAEIGTPLLIRGRRTTVKLTAAGEALYISSKRIIKEVEQAKQDALRAGRGETGILTIAHTDDFNADFLSNVLHEFHHQYPGSILRYYQDVSLSMTERLLSGELDCIFLLEPINSALVECQTRILTTSPLVLAVPENHRLAKRKKVKLKDIAGEQHLYAASDIPNALDQKIAQLLAKAEVRIVSNVQSISTEISLNMVRQGSGVLLASHGSISSRKGVVLVNIDEKGAALSRVAVWRNDNQNPTLKNFLKILELEGPDRSRPHP